MPDTTRSEIAAEVNNFYDRVLLMRAIPAFVHNRFAQVRDIPRKGGTDVIKFRRYGNLTAATTPLSEGITPSGSQLSTSDITATVLQYGDYITITDIVDMESYDPILTETAEILGDQVGDTLDQLCRDIIAAGSTVQYASSASQRSEITAAMKLNRDEVKEAVRTLKSNNTRMLTQMINPTDGYNTTPIGRGFVGIVSEYTAFDLDDATGWVPVEKYPNKANVMPNEIGALAGVRFLETTNAKTFASTVTVHATLVFGANAYAQSRISGESLKNIVKPLGSGGTADPLNQRATSGWKARYVARILNDNFLVRIEHGVTA